MYNPSMKQRLSAAILLFCVALAVLLVRYVPPYARIFEPGDPLASQAITGFYLPEHLGGLIVRRTLADATLHLPLNDSRGAQTVSLWLRAATEQPSPLRLRFGATVVTNVPPALRTYHLFVPPGPSRSFDLALQHVPHSATDRGPLNLLVDQVVVRGRAGGPSSLDLMALVAIALIPVLLLALAARLPLDWALLPGVLCIGVLVLLPASDRPTLLAFGPLAALIVGAVALLPLARAYPTIALVTLGGAALRCYALGWGSGMIVQPEEQALAGRAAAGWLSWTIPQIADVAALISGRAAWQEPWALVLIGRSMAALVGSALIVAVYALGRQLLLPRWALLASAYVAVTPLLVQQSHSATESPLDALVVVLLMLCHTLAAQHGSWRWLGAGGVLALVLAATHREGWPLALALLIAPTAAQPSLWRMLRYRAQDRRPRWLLLGSCLVILVIGAGLAYWSVTTLTTHNLLPVQAADQPSSAAVRDSARITEHAVVDGGRIAAVTSFTVLTWGLGPLLVQLGLVGWGAGVFASLRLRKQRWWPLLAGMGGYVALVGLGAVNPAVDLLPGASRSSASVRSLAPLAPLLCLTSALLLQLFARRLRYGLGRRTVRLLAGTALCLALAVALGLLNIYHQPDTRLAASRWLLTHAAPQQIVLQDATMREPLPLGLTHLFVAATLPDAISDDPAVLDAAVAMLRQADYIVLAAERSDIDVARLAQTDPLRACYYAALFDGRLGFVPRARFAVTPRIVGWSIDDSRTDPRLRLYDHPPVRIFQRVASPTPAALELLLRCSDPAR